MPAISVLIKPSSGMCNMKCDYCFYCDETERREQANYGFMSESTLKNVIRRTLPQAEGMITYAFQGGEPTLRGLDFFRQLMVYVKQYNKKQIPVQLALQTNGFALDEAWCQFFHENHVLVGLSVDGLQSIHDRYRHTRQGAPTYERIVAAAKLLDQYQVDYNILTVVTRDVAEQIEEIYANYKQNGWKYLQFIPCLNPLEICENQTEAGSPCDMNHSVPSGITDEADSTYTLTPSLYGEFLTRLFRLWVDDIQRGEQPYIRQFENYIGMLMGYPPEACDQRGTCGIQYVVEADGSVYPCDFYMLDEYRLGNFNQDRIPVIDQTRLDIGFLERSIKLNQECRGCEFYFICRGGCQRQRELIKGSDLYQNSLCEGFRRFFSECLDSMKELAKKLRNEL